MNFRKFDSIENTYIKSNVSKIVFNGLDSGQWIVTEKLHGANFAIYIKNGKVVNFGSRNQFVDGSFYDSELLQRELQEGIDESFIKSLEYSRMACRRLYNKSIDIDPDNHEIIIYGELVGSRVQKEIYYCDDLMFYMFDMVVNGKAIDKEVARVIYYQSHEWAVCAPRLLSGSFDDCIKYGNTFNSLIAGKADNEAEGIIIEPVTPLYYNNGKRICLKNKTKRFSEKNDGVVDVTFKELTEKDNSTLNELRKYINVNRLNAVKSKGHPERALMYMMVKDIVEDYNKDNPYIYSDMDMRKDCDNFKLLMSHLQFEVNKFIIKGEL